MLYGNYTWATSLQTARGIYFKMDLLWTGSIHLMKESGRLRKEAVDRTRERGEIRRDEGGEKQKERKWRWRWRRRRPERRAGERSSRGDRIGSP